MSLGLTYAEQGQYDLALRTTEQIAAHPVWGFIHGALLAESGNEQQARDILETIDKIPRNVIALTLTNAALGETDEVFYWMAVAKEVKLPWYPWFITGFSFMDEARRDPRMRRLAEELGLEEALERSLQKNSVRKSNLVCWWLF